MFELRIKIFAALCALAFAGCEAVSQGVQSVPFVFFHYEYAVSVAQPEVLWKVGNDAVVVDPAGRAEYNALILRYGARFNPQLHRDAGLKPNVRWFGGFNPRNSYVIDPDHTVFYSIMKEWRFYEPERKSK